MDSCPASTAAPTSTLAHPLPATSASATLTIVTATVGSGWHERSSAAVRVAACWSILNRAFPVIRLGAPRVGACPRPETNVW